MDLGPLKHWDLKLDHGQIVVSPGSCETNLKGIYAVGDVATYPHKLKLRKNQRCWSFAGNNPADPECLRGKYQHGSFHLLGQARFVAEIATQVRDCNGQRNVQ